MIDRIKNEPALYIGLVQAILALVVTFGLDLSVEQVGAILAVTAAVLSVVTRTQVTPTRTIEVPEAAPPAPAAKGKASK